MKEPPASKGSPKIRLRFKAKDLERMDLEEMRRFLEAARLPEIEAEPEAFEEEPVGVVPPELLEVVELIARLVDQMDSSTTSRGL